MSDVLTPLIPVIVWVHQQAIQVVQLPDGRLAATLKSLCEALTLNYPGQLQRIRRNWALTQQLLLALVMTPNGAREMEVLVIDAIRPWLVGIQVSRLAPEKRAIAYELQGKAMETILRQFSQTEASQETVPPPGPPTTDSPRSAWDWLLAALDETTAALDETRRALVALRREEQAERARLEQRLLEQEQRVADLKEWFTSLDQRVATVDQRQQDAALAWEPGLSATHLTDLKAIFRDLEQFARRTSAQLEEELCTLFKVEAITAIPDAFWPEVLAWYAWSVRPA